MITRRVMMTAVAAMPVAAMAASSKPAIGVIRLSPALDRVIAPGASIETLASGFTWAEGPVWVAEEESLYFTDPKANIAYRWNAGTGAKMFLSPAGLQGPVPSGISEPGLNGLAIDREGHLIAADSGSRVLVRIDLRTKRRTILADRFQSKRFNSPNDLCIAPTGDIYFTDPPYGLADGDNSPLRELAQNGVYMLSPGGEVTLLDGEQRRPNGVALSPDGRTLYLALSDEKRPEVHAYKLDAKGRPVDRMLFYDMRKHYAAGFPGLPDGIKVAPDGHVFATGPGGVHILAPDGEPLGMLSTGKPIANCCLGDGGKRLFLTASDQLVAIEMQRRS